MILHPVPRRLWSLALAVLAAAAGSGCTSVLSTASLRDIFVGVDDHAAESEIPSGPRDDAPGDDTAGDTADTERRAAAIEEAIARLSKVDDLTDAARDSLVATLQRTDQEDWPVVVEAFVESLASAPATHTAAKANLDTDTVTSTSDASLSVADEEPEPTATVKPTATVEATAPPEPASIELELAPSPAELSDVAPAPVAVVAAVSMPATPANQPKAESTRAAETLAPEEAPSPEVVAEPVPTAGDDLAIRNACFATRVQAWGVLDRFTADTFRPGQEVIVYFELDGLKAGESAAGHTTCIDSRLRLVTEDGATVHDWTFEPIAETCRARRHDYFARYMVRIPAGATAGRHRIELAVTDTLSGQKAAETIDLEILAPPHAAE
jgi:hypothetical protein